MTVKGSQPCFLCEPHLSAMASERPPLRHSHRLSKAGRRQAVPCPG